MDEIKTETPQVDPLDLLLSGKLSDMRRDGPRGRYKVDRLSAEAGGDVIFELRGLTCEEITTVRSMPAEERDVQTVVLGCIKPDFKDGRLYGPGTGKVGAADAVKAALLPGEIAELAYHITKLCGYHDQMVTELVDDVKNA